MTPLKLYYPCKPFVITQKFAENKACCNPDMSGVVSELPNGTCPVGKVKLYPLLGMAGHTGIDLYAPDSTVLRAPHDGIVKELSLEVERGLGVGIVTHEKVDMGVHGIHYAKTRQWHGKKILVEYNQSVKVGDPIMLADNTGLSAGSHNHFELKPVQYGANNTHSNVYQNNGFFGSIDPVPFFTGLYAENFYTTPKASEEILRFAAKLELQGNTTAAKQMRALADVIKAFGY